MRQPLFLALGALVCHLAAVLTVSAQTAAPSLLRMVDSSTGADVVSFGKDITSVSGMALSADGTQLAAVVDTAAGSGHRLQLWAADGGEPQATLWTSGDPIANVCFSPDGKYVAASGAGVVLVWDVGSRREVARIRGQADVHSLVFSPGGDWLAEGGKQIVMHRVGEWRTSRSISLASDAQSLVFTSDGARIIAGLTDGTVVWLDAREGARAPVTSVRVSSSPWQPLIASSADGAVFAATGEERSAVISSADGTRVSTIGSPFSGAARAVAFQPGTHILALAGADGLVRLFDAETAKGLRTLDFGETSIRGLAFTPDGRGLIVGSAARGAVATRGLKPVTASRVNLAGRHDYALMFATNDYDHWPGLVNPIPDAQTLKQVLEEDYGFTVKLVTNPTREQVLDELRLAHQQTFGHADQLLIFFAGHGMYDHQIGDGFVVAKDSRQEDTSHTSQVSYSDLKTSIDSIPADHILVTMDVCQGGMMLGRGSRGTGQSGRLTLSELLAKKVGLRTRRLLASGLDAYVSDGIPGRHSPFVRALLEKLRSEGGDEGYITSASLFGSLQTVNPGPVIGDWGSDDPGSEFFFIPRRTQRQLADALPPAPTAAGAAAAPDPAAAGSVRVTSATRRSIAVLPFRNLRPETAVGYLSAFLETQMRSEINAAATLRALDEGSVNRMVHDQRWDRSDEISSEQLAWAARNYGADLVLTGSYAPLGNSDNVAVKLQVIDTRDHSVLYESSATGKESDPSSILRLEGAKLRRAVGAGDGSPQPVTGMPQSPEAAASYASALQKMQLNEFAAARDLLEKVIVIEPTFALGHARLAEVYSSLGYDARARDASQAAFDRREGLPPNEAKLIEGRFYASNADWTNAAAAFSALWSYNSDTIDYALDLADVDVSRGQPSQAVTLIARLLEKAPAPADALRLELAAARAYMDMGDYRNTKSSAERAVKSAEDLHSEALLAEALLYNSIASRHLGDTATALAAAERGLKIVADGNALLRARLLTAVGNVYFERGDLDNSLRVKNEALQVARNAEDQRDLSGALLNLANIMNTRGDFDQAVGYYREAIDVAKRIEDHQGEGLAKFNMALILRAKGNLADARETLEDSERLYRSVNNDLRAARASREVGVILLETGQPAESLKRLTASRSVLERDGDDGDRAGVMMSLGDALGAQGDVPAALDRYEQASAICTKAKDVACDAASKTATASLLLSEGQFDKAVTLASTAAETLHAEKSPAGEAEARAILAIALLGQNQRERALGEIEKTGTVKSPNRLWNIYLEIKASRVRAQVDGGKQAALDRLQALAREARQMGATKAALEAELAIVDIDGAAGGREAVRKEASDLGYGLIARLAAR